MKLCWKATGGTLGSCVRGPLTLEGSSILYTSLSVRVGRIGAKLVCLSITSKQAKVAPEYCHAV